VIRVFVVRGLWCFRLWVFGEVVFGGGHIVALKCCMLCQRVTLALVAMVGGRLSDLWIRPAFGGRGRKMSGTLEAHTNGYRYSTMRQEEKVDIMYRNIKHAFFQPAEKEMITLVHFHLHNYIMVGTKKTKDVQFYVEVCAGARVGVCEGAGMESCVVVCGGTVGFFVAVGWF
jgi:hypothetical protein